MSAIWDSVSKHGLAWAQNLSILLATSPLRLKVDCNDFGDPVNSQLLCRFLDAGKNEALGTLS